MQIVSTQNKGIRVTVDGGWQVSIQWGPYNYGSLPDSEVEVAIFDVDGEFIPDASMVYPYLDLLKVWTFVLALNDLKDKTRKSVDEFAKLYLGSGK